MQLVWLTDCLICLVHLTNPQLRITFKAYPRVPGLLISTLIYRGAQLCPCDVRDAYVEIEPRLEIEPVVMWKLRKILMLSLLYYLSYDQAQFPHPCH